MASAYQTTPVQADAFAQKESQELTVIKVSVLFLLSA